MEDREIIYFLHCKECLKDLPQGLSPRDFSNVEVGLTQQGTILVRCIRHDLTIVEFKIEPLPKGMTCNFCERKEYH